MSTKEESFYKNDFRKAYKDYDFKQSNSYKNLRPDCFDIGGRYRICIDALDKNKKIEKNLIVELGCSTGETLSFLKNNYGFENAIGCDFIFNEKIEINNCQFFSANLNEKWPIPDSGADCLIAMMLFEHLFDPWFCFSEVKRVLSPKGSAFINLPLVTSIKNRLRLAFGKLPITSVPYEKWKEEGHWDGFHLHYFNLSTINDLVKKSELKIVRQSAVGKYTKFKNFYPTFLCNEISFELTHANQTF